MSNLWFSLHYMSAEVDELKHLKLFMNIVMSDNYFKKSMMQIHLAAPYIAQVAPPLGHIVSVFCFIMNMCHLFVIIVYIKVFILCVIIEPVATWDKPLPTH